MPDPNASSMESQWENAWDFKLSVAIIAPPNFGILNTIKQSISSLTGGSDAYL